MAKLPKQPTADELAAIVGDLSDQKRELLELLLKEQGLDLAGSVILPQKREVSGDGNGSRMPLSFAQERLWFLDQFEPGSPVYNLPAAVKLSGELDVDTLKRSVQEIISRHEILRTTFGADAGEPYQLIHDAFPIEIPEIDLRSLPEPARQIEISRLSKEDAGLPFNLTTGPLIRVTLLLVNDKETIALVNVHHIIADGWSVGVLIYELSIIYQAYKSGKANPLNSLKVQYADYAIWQKKRLQGKLLDEQLIYWSNKLSGNLPVLDFPTDYPRPAVQTSNGSSYRFRLSLDLTRKLQDLSQRENTTLFITLLAGFQVLLYRYTGQDDICVGVPVTNRIRAEIEGLIGFFVNTVVLRNQLERQEQAEPGKDYQDRNEKVIRPSFRKFLGQVHETAMQAFSHQEVPFEMLVEKLDIDRNMSHSPLFQVMFSMQNTLLQTSQIENLAMTSLPVDSGSSKFDFTFMMATEHTDETEQISGAIEFNTDLFERKTIERLASHYVTLLESIIANPDQSIAKLPLLTYFERERLIFEWNTTDIDYSQVQLHQNSWLAHQLFEYRAQQNPNATAVIYFGIEGDPITGKEHLLRRTYAEINQQAVQMAIYLRAHGLQPGMIVGLLVQRSVEMIVGILGILKAGGAYLPLDPTYPVDRLRFMIEDSQIPILITQTSISLPENLISEKNPLNPVLQVLYLDKDWNLIQNMSDDSSGPKAAKTKWAKPKKKQKGMIGMAVDASPDNPLAYVIYTSGSTGKPKGVLLRHRGLTNLVNWQRKTFKIDNSSRVLQFAPFSFDASVWEIFMALANGATLCMTSQEVLSNGSELIRLLRQLAISVVTLPPSLLSALPQEQITTDALPDLKTVIAAGEACSQEIVARWAPGRKFFNAYGPTETTVCATAGICDEEDRRDPGIGRPIANTHVYVFDRNLEVTPVGVPGELYIGGVSTALGYLNRPELTAEKFIDNHLSDEIAQHGLAERSKEPLYKTGDLVRYRLDGTLEFLGRIDQQVKLRGYRIELGEIETAIRQYSINGPVGKIRVVRDAVVLIQDFGSQKENRRNQRLVAFVIPEIAGESASGNIQTQEGVDQIDINQADLREYLRRSLPEYMVPTFIVLLSELPITPSGKVDRKALAKYKIPELYGREVKSYQPPRTPFEQHIASMFIDVLKVERVGILDNFFELGGHSLLATQLISRLSKVFQVEVPLKTLFEAPTVAQLANRVESAIRSSAWGARLDVKRLPRNLETGLLLGPAPISYAQQRLWFLEQLKPGTASYNIPSVIRLTGELDFKALEMSINKIVERHEVLRSSIITEGGEPRLLIAPSLQVEIPVIELEELIKDEYELQIDTNLIDRAEAIIRYMIGQEVLQPIELSRLPLFRIKAIRISKEETILILVIHHIISDGWSIGIMMQEVSACYAALSGGMPIEAAGLPDLEYQYSDYSAWQQLLLQGQFYNEQVLYWKNRLKDVPPLLDLPTDRPRPAIQSTSGAQVKFKIAPYLAQEIYDLSQETGVTLFMGLLAAFQILLMRYSGMTDICVGTPISNRTRTEFENLIGFFVNTLVIRIDLSDGPSFINVLKQVRDSALGAYAHQELPFEALVSELQPERSLSHSPLFQVMFVMQNLAAQELDLPGLKINEYPVFTGIAKFDLTLTLSGDERGLRGALEYNTDLFDKTTIERFARHYLELLESLANDPEQLILLGRDFTGLKWSDISTREYQAELVLSSKEAQSEQKKKKFRKPRTWEEKALIQIWSQVLGIDQIGIEDNFFELGGDSILSIQVTSQANQLGLPITPQQIFENQTILKLAEVARLKRQEGTGRVINAEQGLITGDVQFTPIQRWFFELDLHNPSHFNQSILLKVPQPLSPKLLDKTVQLLLEHHDSLRLRFNSGLAGWNQFIVDREEHKLFETIDCSLISEADRQKFIETETQRLQNSLDIANGPIVRMAYFRFELSGSDRLFIVIHHLAVDGVSWRILLEDLQRIYKQLAERELNKIQQPGGAIISQSSTRKRKSVLLPPKTTSYKYWAGKLTEFAGNARFSEEMEFWLRVTSPGVDQIRLDKGDASQKYVHEGFLHTTLSKDETNLLLQKLPSLVFNRKNQIEVQDILLTALVYAQKIQHSGDEIVTESQPFQPTTLFEPAVDGEINLLLAVEAHGREELSPEIDLSRTVGWFTNIYPLRLHTVSSNDLGRLLKTVREQSSKIPNHGIGYGILRYLDEGGKRLLAGQAKPQISFNYLGQFDPSIISQFEIAPEPAGVAMDPEARHPYLVEINCGAIGGQLSVDWSFSSNSIQPEQVVVFSQNYLEGIREIIKYCLNYESMEESISASRTEYNAADFPLADIDQSSLDNLLSTVLHRKDSKASKSGRR